MATPTPYTFYDASIVTTQRVLNTMSTLLEMAQKSPQASTLPTARLYENMQPLSAQVHLITQAVTRMLNCLAGKQGGGLEMVENDVKTWEDMERRIAASQKQLAALDKDTVNKTGAAVTSTTIMPGITVPIQGSAWLMGSMVPNIFFHVNMAYAILRKEGLDLSKSDYILGFMGPELLKLGVLEEVEAQLDAWKDASRK